MSQKRSRIGARIHARMPRMFRLIADYLPAAVEESQKPQETAPSPDASVPRGRRMVVQTQRDFVVCKPFQAPQQTLAPQLPLPPPFPASHAPQHSGTFVLPEDVRDMVFGRGGGGGSGSSSRAKPNRRRRR